MGLTHHPLALAALDLAAGAMPDQGGYLRPADRRRLRELLAPSGLRRFAEWDESKHPRDQGKFARKQAHKESRRHLARAGRLWYQRTPLDEGHPGYRAIDPLFSDLDH